MKLFPILLILISLSTYDSFPQNIWTNVFGGSGSDDGRAVINTYDNGAIFVCTTQSFGNGSVDIWLIKTDEFGDTLWSKTYGGSKIDAAENPNCIIETMDTCYIITGSTNSWSSSQHDFDIYLIKIDRDGNKIWEKNWGDNGRQDGLAVIQTDIDHFLLLGLHGNSTVMYKFDLDGNVIWEKAYGEENFGSARAFTLDKDGAIVITGTNYVDEHLIWLLKTDSNGDTQWTRSYSEGIDNQYQWGVSVLTDLSGNYSIICHVIDRDGANYPHFIKVSPSGDLLFEKIFEAKLEYEHPDIDISSAEKTIDDGFILTGEINTYSDVNLSDVILIKMDTDFNTSWIRQSENDTWNNWVRGWAVRESSNSGYLICAWFDRDAMLMKTDSLGNFLIPTYTDVEANSIMHNSFSLSQNYPNPFNPSTTIKYTIPGSTEYNSVLQNVKLNIYDILGREVATLINQKQKPGSYVVEFMGNELPSGIYFYRLQAGNFIETKKMILLK